MSSRLRIASLLVAIGLAASACGSNLTDSELAAANGALTTEETSAAGSSTGDSAAPDSGVTSTTLAGTDAPGGGTSSGGSGGATTDPGAGGTAAPAQAGAGSACPPGSGGKEIVFGTFGTEGGVIGANVATAPVGLRAWTADVNARGGLCGHPVRVVFGGNDNGDPATAVSIARRLIERDKVVAILAPYAPTAMPPVYDVVERAGVPVIADASAGTRGDSSPMSFNPTSSFQGLGYGFSAAFVEQTTARKVAIISLAEVAGAAVSVQEIRRNAPLLGYQIVYEAQVSIASPDFTAQVTEARSRGADVLIGVVDFTTMLKIIRSAQRQGYKPQFSGSHAFVTDAVKASAADFEGATAYSPTAVYTGPQLAEYRAAVAAYVPRGELGLLGPVAWAGGKLLEVIAPKLGANPTSADIINALYTVQNEDLGGIVPKFSFTKGARSPYSNDCVQPSRFVGGQWTAPAGPTSFSCRK